MDEKSKNRVVDGSALIGVLEAFAEQMGRTMTSTPDQERLGVQFREFVTELAAAMEVDQLPFAQEVEERSVQQESTHNGPDRGRLRLRHHLQNPSGTQWSLESQGHSHFYGWRGRIHRLGWKDDSA